MTDKFKAEGYPIIDRDRLLVAAVSQIRKEEAAKFKLLGETRSNGVVWFDQNPHAFPLGTTFYAKLPDSKTKELT